MAEPSLHTQTEKGRCSTERSSTTLFQCPGEPQPIDQAVHLARLERGYPKCRECEHREQTGLVSMRREQGIRSILSETEPTLPDRFALIGRENDFSDAVRFERWAARFGLFLRRSQPERFSGDRVPHVVLADASPRTVPTFVAAVCKGLRWAGCDVTDLGRGAVGMLHFAKKQLDADAGILLAQPGQWEHECGLCVEGVLIKPLRDTAMEEASLEKNGLDAIFRRLDMGLFLFDERQEEEADVTSASIDRPTRRQGRLTRTSLTELYLESFASRYHGLRPLRIAIYTSCIPVVDQLRRLTAPFDVQIELLPFSVALREGGALDLFGAHFSVYIDGTGRVVELLDEQGVPFSDLEEMTPDAVEVVTAVQILLSRNETPLSELAFGGQSHDRKSGF